MIKLTGKVINNSGHKNKEGRIKSNRDRIVKNCYMKKKS